jgi:hypothetical protein
LLSFFMKRAGKIPSSPTVFKGPKPAIEYRILSSEMILDASSQFSSVGGSTESGGREISSELGSQPGKCVSRK